MDAMFKLDKYMVVSRRVVHLASFHKKARVRKKNVNRLFKNKPDKYLSCYRVHGGIIFHEYNIPEEVYIKQYKEEGLI